MLFTADRLFEAVKTVRGYELLLKACFGDERLIRNACAEEAYDWNNDEDIEEFGSSDFTAAIHGAIISCVGSKGVVRVVFDPIMKLVTPAEAEVFDFYNYFRSFYNPRNGVYPDVFEPPYTKAELMVATKEHIASGKDAWGRGDTVDREKVRDIILNKRETAGATTPA